MKNFILIALTCLVISSCQKRDNYTSNKLVGSWYVTYDLLLFKKYYPMFPENDSIISNITLDPNNSNKVLFDNIFNISGASDVIISMIDNNINIENQFGPFQQEVTPLSYHTISGNGIYSNNQFILMVYTDGVTNISPDGNIYQSVDTFKLSCKRK